MRQLRGLDSRVGILFVLCLRCCWAETYTIAGLAIGSTQIFLRDFKPTFESYLSEEVSQKMGRTVTFKLIAVSINADQNTIFDLVLSREVDFIYSFPNIFGCLESEFDVSPLATVRKDVIVSGKKYNLNRYYWQYVIQLEL
jgi:hypothetical protein